MINYIRIFVGGLWVKEQTDTNIFLEQTLELVTKKKKKIGRQFWW